VIAAPPPVALTAAPARIELAGAADETLLVSNPSRGAAVVDVRPAGFALDLHGWPRILVRRDASVHVTVEPHRLVLRPGQTGSATVTSTIAPGARPGDHVALVVLATHTRGTAGVGVRMQLGVVVTVRVPGRVVHRLEVRGMHARPRTLEIVLRNRGNVTEDVGPSNMRVVLRRAGRVIGRLRPRRRELLPGTAGIVEVRRPRLGPGSFRAIVELRGAPAHPVRRSFRLRVRAR
jgi:hypothetical protein